MDLDDMLRRRRLQREAARLAKRKIARDARRGVTTSSSAKSIARRYYQAMERDQ